MLVRISKGGTVLKLAEKDLARSDITLEEAEESGMYYEADASTIYEDFEPLPCLVIPYHDPWSDDLFTFERDGETLEFCRVRYLKEPMRRRFGKKKAQRYGQPRDSGVHAYFPLVEHFDWLDVFDDPSIPIVITEGEKKALRGCLAGYPTIGLGGVYNFMSQGELLAVLDRIKWKGRKVFLCYDSDAAENPNIQAAESRLAGELSTKRKALVFLTRLEHAEDGSKQGIDDLILHEGEDAFEAALRASYQIKKSDAHVLKLNEQVCIINKDEAIYEFRTREFMSKQHFKDASQYATLNYEVPKERGEGLKRVYVAPLFLKHEHALRYDDIVFDPTTDERVVERNGRRCLNSWEPLEGVPGDVTPFLELTRHVSSTLAHDQQDFLLKLMAYRVQNPGEKIPIAIVMVGDQGSGKSMWAKMIRLAMGKYGYPLKNSALKSDFNGWIERSIIAVLDEAQGPTVRANMDYLKTLISEHELTLNEKYRKARPVSTPTMYILTSNDRSAAAFEHDDRRMFVIDVRGKLPKEWYVNAGAWMKAGGCRHVLHYLQTLDLKGWRPPNEAPMTHEKNQAYQESLTDVQRIAETMKKADENIVAMWCDAAMNWAVEFEGSNIPTLSQQAAEVRIALRNMPIRPVYTPEELAKILPHLAYQLGGSKLSNTAAGELSRQLRSAGIRYLIPEDNSLGFLYRGQFRQFLVVSNIDEIPHSLSQNKFDRLIKSAPTYGQLRGIT
jgi:hypothetical protein